MFVVGLREHLDEQDEPRAVLLVLERAQAGFNFCGHRTEVKVFEGTRVGTS